MSDFNYKPSDLAMRNTIQKVIENPHIPNPEGKADQIMYFLGRRPSTIDSPYVTKEHQIQIGDLGKQGAEKTEDFALQMAQLFRLLAIRANTANRLMNDNMNIESQTSGQQYIDKINEDIIKLLAL